MRVLTFAPKDDKQPPNPFQPTMKFAELFNTGSDDASNSQRVQLRKKLLLRAHALQYRLPSWPSRWAEQKGGFIAPKRQRTVDMDSEQKLVHLGRSESLLVHPPPSLGASNGQKECSLVLQLLK